MFNTDDLLLLRFPRALALLIHQFFESSDVNRKAALPRHEFCQIERKPLLVVQSKRELAGDRICRPDLALEQFEAAIEGFVK